MSVLSTEVALSGATRSSVAHAPMYPGRVLQSTLTLLQPLEVGGHWPLHLGDSSRSPGPFGTFRQAQPQCQLSFREDRPMYSSWQRKPSTDACLRKGRVWSFPSAEVQSGSDQAGESYGLSPNLTGPRWCCQMGLGFSLWDLERFSI